jgi:D-alanine-D-alanine ligase
VNVTLLVYVENEDRPEFDVSVEQIADALRGLGHTATVFPVHSDVDRLLAGLREQRPDLVFNLLEQFGDRLLGLVEVTGLIDLLDLPYTGSGAGELFLQEDKTLAKKLLAYEDVKTPDFAVFSAEADLETGGHLRMPLFVKPLRMDASFGIDAGTSLVHNTADMMRAVLDIHEKFEDAALCEQYIEGREFYVGLLGNQQPRAFPPVEMDFSGMPEGAPHVMDSKAKFDQGTPEYRGTKPVIADLPDELRAKLQEVALDTYRILRLKDYGRIDLRLTEAGDVYVIEANANCYLERNSEYAMSAAAAGLEFPQLVEQIVQLATERFAQRDQMRRKRNSPRA